MVMVTHRLGVIRGLNVNKVIVLDQGRIVEMGNPEDLLRHENSLYSGLAREQGIFAINGSVKPATTTATTTVPSSSATTTTES
jgi:ABC-type glutathione transport system ATPase component